MILKESINQSSLLHHTQHDTSQINRTCLPGVSAETGLLVVITRPFLRMKADFRGWGRAEELHGGPDGPRLTRRFGALFYQTKGGTMEAFAIS